MSVTSIQRNLERISTDRILEELVQLRSDYTEESLEELGGSVEDEGVLQPIVVAPTEDGYYELIIGSRRLRAAKRKQLKDIPAIVIEQRSPLNYLLMALAENLHREDLNAFEEARAFLRLMKDYGLGVQQVAEKTRKGTYYVTARIQLLSLPEEVQALIAQKSLGLAFVQVLAQLGSGDEQTHYASKAVSDRLTPPELRSLINRDTGGVSSPHTGVRQLSVEKVRVRVEMFTTWLKKIPSKTIIKRLNATERSVIAEALHHLEVEIRTLRGLFAGGREVEQAVRTPSPGNLIESPRNSGAEWPSGDLSKITATDRPSDEELARQLGRTIPAIRAMRYKAENPAKRKAS